MSLRRYKLLSLLGDGGMGRVFLARDMVLQRDVALKVIQEELREAQDSGRLEQFLREAQAVARLSHPNIVNIYDLLQKRGVVAIAMELVSGGTLKDIIDAPEETPVEEVCKLVAEAADGLASAHAAGLIHRDIKPSNLMLTERRQCKVVDFGATHDTGKYEMAMLEGKIIGTPHYISPEVIKGQSPVPESDIYSMGIVIWTMLVKKPPYTSKKKKQIYLKHINDPIPDITLLRDDIPQRLVELIYGCMAKEPEDRIQTMDQLASQLREIGASCTVCAKDQCRLDTEDRNHTHGSKIKSHKKLPPARQRRHRLITPVIVCLLILLAMATSWIIILQLS